MSQVNIGAKNFVSVVCSSVARAVVVSVPVAEERAAVPQVEFVPVLRRLALVPRHPVLRHEIVLPPLMRVVISDQPVVK